ncbi:MAG TPA: alpha/beta family hydrolase [Rhodanobacteraceae bacterium]|jgi:predicted alpha/beta-hydrolase family hydrolase|nr:alpha/beta family hydrolase [Rhodanobacteraceae bacterium]
MGESVTATDEPRDVTMAVDAGRQVSGILLAPAKSRACYVLAHGAGAGMRHPFMASIANELAQHGIATLRYQFPYMEFGSRRPDAPAIAHATVRAAVAEAKQRLPGCALFAGGKSFGGRMTSQAQSLEPLPGVDGLVFLGFPLHPAGKPSDDRATHLSDVHIPMLFVQGTRDDLADLALVRALTERLGADSTLSLVADADHSFHVPARSGRSDAMVIAGIADVVAAWIDQTVSERKESG